MALALELAQQALPLSDPNPRVGCVIVDGRGVLIGRGFTQRIGGPHAEIVALRDAACAGQSTANATVYVTLEPCSHQGRTGPCCDALIAAGIAKVVTAIQDPNPRVSGQGIARLRAAGVAVEIGLGAAQSRELNIGFFSRMLRARPWVRLKIAASLDGTTALDNGQSQWITGEAARSDGHAWRRRASAVLTGVGTVLEDDPRLDVRLADAALQPALVIVDSRLQTPLHAKLWSVEGRRVWIYAAQQDEAKAAEFRRRGATVVVLPGANGKVDLALMMSDLAQREVNELHVEAGHKLNGSLVRAGLVDELLVYLAPRLLGPARGMTHLFTPLQSLSAGLDLEFRSVEMIGNDLRIVARVAGRDRF